MGGVVWRASARGEFAFIRLHAPAPGGAGTCKEMGKKVVKKRRPGGLLRRRGLTWGPGQRKITQAGALALMAVWRRVRPPVWGQTEYTVTEWVSSLAQYRRSPLGERVK